MSERFRDIFEKTSTDGEREIAQAEKRGMNPFVVGVSVCLLVLSVALLTRSKSSVGSFTRTHVERGREEDEDPLFQAFCRLLPL